VTVMVCKPCLEKWIKYYLSKGFNQKQSIKMARKVIKRVAKRERQERFRELKRKFNSFLRKWAFETNWKATLYWRKWIGKGGNSPYHYKYDCLGTCSPMLCPYYLIDCVDYGDCEYNFYPIECALGDCGCPSPLPNSRKVSDDCACLSENKMVCRTCSMITLLCSIRWYYCPCSGSCYYECNDGYVWDGVQCVPVAKVQFGDGLTWTG